MIYDRTTTTATTAAAAAANFRAAPNNDACRLRQRPDNRTGIQINPFTQRQSLLLAFAFAIVFTTPAIHTHI